MPQPAARTGGAPLPSDPIAALRYYSSIGLRTMPITAYDKTPHPNVGEWKVLQIAPPLGEGLIDQIATWGPINVALLTDEHLVCVDIDNLVFSAWFEAQGPERLACWCVRSPRGGLHVYLRSGAPCAGRVLKTQAGVKVCDVKARGGYVVAPPSVGRAGEYLTEYGSPEQIGSVPDVLQWITSAIERWERVSNQPVPITVTEQAEYASVRVQDPPPEADQQALLDRLKGAWAQGSLSRLAFRALALGEIGDWTVGDDHSAIDFGCIKELVACGWTIGEIEQLFSFNDLGGYRYRSNHKSRGHGYLLRTFDAATRAHTQDLVDLQTMVGNGWQITEPVVKWQNDNDWFYGFGLRDTQKSDPPARLVCRMWDLGTPQRFRDMLLKSDQPIELGAWDSKSRLTVLAQMLKKLATASPLPEIATAEGSLRAALSHLVRGQVGPRDFDGTVPPPEVACWRSGPFIYARGYALLHSVRSMRFNPNPSAATVWEQWQALGGDEVMLGALKLWRIAADRLSA